MKHVQTILILLISVVIFSACSTGAGKFEGEWVTADGATPNSAVISIENENGAYTFYEIDGAGVKNKKGIFLYDEGKDALILTEQGEDVDISYNKQKKGIVINNNGAGDSVEFTRKN